MNSVRTLVGPRVALGILLSVLAALVSDVSGFDFSRYRPRMMRDLVPIMKAELRPREEIELFMIYIGQVDGRHVFLVNAFDHERPH